MQKFIKWFTGGALIATIMFTVLFRFYPVDVFLSLAITAGTIFYHFAMRLLVGFLYNLFMKNRADYRKSWYNLKPWESALYRRIHVKNWKGKLPTYNPDSFNPRKYSLEEIAQTMCQSELVHETIVVLSFLPILASVWFESIGVFAITSVFAAEMDMIFVIVQRYNRHRIIQIIDRRAR